MNDKKSKIREHYLGIGVTLGMTFGVALGACFGVAFGNIAMGVGFGLSLGLALGIAVGSVRGNKHANAVQESPEADRGRHAMTGEWSSRSTRSRKGGEVPGHRRSSQNA
jgi:hypothetical protein